MSLFMIGVSKFKVRMGHCFLSACRSDWQLPFLIAFMAVSLCSCFSFARNTKPPNSVLLTDDEIDAALQREASTSLGTRDGTVIVLDPQTGRIRAIVNERQAFQDAYPPGSTIKPFTALTAMRARLIDADSRTYCHERYKQGDFETHCSHTRFKPPFNPVQALAYSCNYYFAKLGERLNGQDFNEVLSEFGMGSRTGSDDSEEASGLLPRNTWKVQSALGEGGQLLVTPAQLITAYSALVNGGHLFTPHAGPASGFASHSRGNPILDATHRDLLVRGMQGAITYGTASHAGFGSLPLAILGKTGTATPLDDVHSQGWFVGFAADANSNANLEPEKVHLAVLVFLKHARGADCANISRAIFNEFSRVSDTNSAPVSIKDRALTAEEDSVPGSSPVRVDILREGVTKTLSLDDYVFGVLAAEASLEDEYEAVKAQAVIIRTFALRNLARHAREGYDFCTNTHCQRYVAIEDEGRRPEFYNTLHKAIEETNGETLRDGGRRIAEAYFSADCGGMTANVQTLWGKAPVSYLRGVRDEYCAGSQYTSWTDNISSARLAKALRSDPRSNVGNHIDDILILRRDTTGRAETIGLRGERYRTVRGWDFKIIVGRALGWEFLKSSRFRVQRSGTDFIFQGSGFGHGLGLCQDGAHVMALRGAGYRQILTHYFPGTSVYKNEKA